MLAEINIALGNVESKWFSSDLDIIATLFLHFLKCLNEESVHKNTQCHVFQLESTFTVIRKKNLWISSGIPLSNSIPFVCVPCQKYNSLEIHPIMYYGQ